MSQKHRLLRCFFENHLFFRTTGNTKPVFPNCFQIQVIISLHKVYMMGKVFILICICAGHFFCSGQQDRTLKLSHAEPLYIDLIRDLGARKGEKELNVGFGVNDYKHFTNYSGFFEYEFAPFNRLGFEVEVPFQFYHGPGLEAEVPENGLEGLKLATQYTFCVSAKYQTSLAFGYIQEFELASFNGLRRREGFLDGTLYNPIFIAAKRWTSNLHTLIYTGPILEQHFSSKDLHLSYQLNANVHYILPGTSNFIGLETNIEFTDAHASVVFRPQMKLKISPGLALGWVTGIPANMEKEGISLMARVIWEPRKKK